MGEGVWEPGLDVWLFHFFSLYTLFFCLLHRVRVIISCFIIFFPAIWSVFFFSLPRSSLSSNIIYLPLFL